MFYSSIPTCYFPSTVVFVDDSREFLLNFILQLDENLSYLVFDTVSDALSCIHKKRYALDWLNQRYSAKHHLRQEAHVDSNSLVAVYAEIYNAKRFSEISVVVVDYAMPEINGLEFCRQIENTHIKKMLLVGPGDESLAIAALEQGLIHHYINKNKPNLAARIVTSIQQLQQDYFQSMSELVTRMLALTASPYHQDPQFITFFKELCHQHKIVEFYQIDRQGSMLMLDDDARISVLQINDSADAGMDSSFANEQCYTKLNIHDYQCIYKRGIAIDVQEDNIVSYHTYLEALDAEELFLA